MQNFRVYTQLRNITKEEVGIKELRINYPNGKPLNNLLFLSLFEPRNISPNPRCFISAIYTDAGGVSFD